MLLTLTWYRCHRSPADTPTSPSITAISNEQELDNVGSASDISRQGVAAAFPQQGCPVAVRDCQVVVITGGIPRIFKNIKHREIQGKGQSILNLYRFCPL